MLLFCFDGLMNMVLEIEMEEILKSKRIFFEKVDVFIIKVNFYGGEDNIIVLLVEWDLM